MSTAVVLWFNRFPYNTMGIFHLLDRPQREGSSMATGLFRLLKGAHAGISGALTGRTFDLPLTSSPDSIRGELNTSAPAGMRTDARASAHLSLPLAMAMVIACATLYYAAVRVGLARQFPDQQFSPLWLPIVVLLPALLLIPPRRWWIPLFAIVPAHLAAYARAELPTWQLAWHIGGSWLVAVGIAASLSLLIGALRERHRTATAIRSWEHALRKSYANVRDLAQRLMCAQEAERARIARDLHDDIGQQLAVVAIELSNLERRLPPGSAELTELIGSLRTNVDGVALALRSLSHELHPATLRHLGLGGAMKGHCRRFAELHGVETDFRAEGELRSLSPELAVCLFRVAQEALRNVARHAHARRAWVRVTRARGEVSLSIGDDGCGFDCDAAAGRASLGLVSIEERVRTAGGRCAIVTRPGAGTRIDVRVPVGD
jgi:signal transduction histidine kinase